MASTATRGAWTCEPCKRRKVKCDRSDPCLNCRRRRETCEWTGNARPEADSSVVKADQQQESIEDLQARIRRIEAVLERSGLAPSSPIDHASARSGHASLGSRLAPDTQAQTAREPPVAIDELVDATPNDAGQSNVNLHDNFDHHIIASSKTQAIHQLPLTDRATQLLHRVLPLRYKCDDLLENYLQRVEWIHHPLDVVRFRAEYQDFWHAYSSDDLHMPSLQWASLLLIVLCLGSHFHAHGSTLDLEEDLYAAAHELLGLSDYLAQHSITTIQTLISMGLWLNSRGLSNTHHVQLAAAIKMAYTLRLNRVDTKDYVRPSSQPSDMDFFSVDRTDTSASVSAHRSNQLELQRRLFWSLVCQDYYTASSCNFTYTIHPEQCRTSLFLNLDDEDLQLDSVSTSPLVAHGVHDLATASTYQLLKIPFARIPKAVADLYNNDALTYTAVLDLEQQLRVIYAGLPEYFKWQSPPERLVPFPASQHVDINHLEWQRIFLGFTLHNRILRLHRPFMARGYVDVAMAHSKTVTVDSAIACLELADYGEQIGFPGLRWWVILIHMFTAGVALSVDLHFLLRGRDRHSQAQANGQRQASVPPSDPRTTEVRRSQIDHVIRLLRPSASSSVAAAQAVTVIEDLVKQAERTSSSPRTVRHEPAAKRRRVDAPNGSNLPLAASSEGAAGHSNAQYASMGTVQPVPDPTWTGLDMPEPDWWGPNWDQVLASFPQDHFAMTVGEETELMETLNSFANGFTWS